MGGTDKRTVEAFGDEWTRFDQSRLDDDEARRMFDQYFAIFPWESLPAAASGFDMGCGSGRWARLVAPRVGRLHCIEPSAALATARANLAQQGNVEFHAAAAHERPLPPASQDFGYSLGVLHHIPDTRAALADCVAMLKPGAPFLVYLYYAFDDRPAWFRALWRVSDGVRRGISRLPAALKNLATDLIAATVYFPLAKFAALAEKLGFDVHALPLSNYRARSFYTMRTDSRDRFGTPLEHRFSRDEVATMMRDAGLDDLRFSDGPPFWCAVGVKR